MRFTLIKFKNIMSKAKLTCKLPVCRPQIEPDRPQSVTNYSLAYCVCFKNGTALCGNLRRPEDAFTLFFDDPAII